MEKQEVNIDHLRKLNAEAQQRGQQIESFQFDEISLVAGGGLEMGPVYNVKYKEIDNGNLRT